MQILSIFLKLQAAKQSGPTFLAYPVFPCSVNSATGKTHKPSDTRELLFVTVTLCCTLLPNATIIGRLFGGARQRFLGNVN